MSRPVATITFGGDLARLELAQAIGELMFALRSQDLELEKQEGQERTYSVVRKESLDS